MHFTLVTFSKSQRHSNSGGNEYHLGCHLLIGSSNPSHTYIHTLMAITAAVHGSDHLSYGNITTATVFEQQSRTVTQLNIPFKAAVHK